jgi:hypothetical protein
MHLMDDWHAAMREAGAPDALRERIAALARPRLELRGPLDALHDDSDRVMGGYGGAPLLPDGIPWDGRPEHIATVDLTALDHDWLDFPLPRSGQLVFFADREAAEDCYAEDGREPAGSVLHIPDGTPVRERRPEGERARFALEPCPLYGRREKTTPAPEDDVFLSVHPELSELMDEHEELYDALCPGGGAGPLTLGGYAVFAQNDPCAARWESTGEEAWFLLAQARYESGADPEVQACASWLIRRADLEAGDFGNVKVMTERILP